MANPEGEVPRLEREEWEGGRSFVSFCLGKGGYLQWTTGLSPIKRNGLGLI